MVYVAPVTMPASSEASQATSEATSSGSTSRLTAISVSMTFWSTSASGMPWVAAWSASWASTRAVRTYPGLMQFEVTPCSAPSRAVTFESPSDPVDRAEVDHPAPAARVHVRQGRADEEERRLDHEPLDAAEGLGLELVQRGDLLDAGVVDEDVAVEAKVLEGAGIEQVHGPRAPAEVRSELLGTVPVEVSDDDVGSALGQGPGGGGADARRSPGHEGLAPGQAHAPAFASAASPRVLAASAASRAWSEVPLVSRIETTATVVIAPATRR